MARLAVAFGVLDRCAARALMTVLMLVSLAACARGSESADPARPVEQVLGPFRVLGPREPVPPFRLIASDGSLLDSDALIGKRPFVIVFFTTWCEVCELKLPIVREVASRHGSQVTFVGVSIDEPETWHRVAPMMRRHGLDFPVVRGEWFPRFALAYDPLQTVPVVAVVGKDGYLVDYQIGWGADHRRRLHAAVALARGDSTYTAEP
jgi:thiol-disulfide isomerase/thioredoxin